MTKPTIPLCRPSDVADFLARLLGQPWDAAGLHCWALVRLAQRELFGRDLPAVLETVPKGMAGRLASARQFAAHPERARWRESGPEHGAIALLRRASAPAEMIVHAGVWLDIDGGVVLHTDQPHGVVADSVAQLVVLRRWAPPVFLMPVLGSQPAVGGNARPEAGSVAGRQNARQRPAMGD